MRTIQPEELKSERPHGSWSCRGRDIWDAFCAAAAGDAPRLRNLLARDPNLYRAEYWYTQPSHFAVREGRIEALSVLLEAGADPGRVALNGDDLATLARDRGHDAVASLLEQERERRARVPLAEIRPDHPIHAAAQQGDLARVRELLDAEPACIGETRASGERPLSAAAGSGHEGVVRLLLERGALPNWPEGAAAPRGLALYAAARSGHRALVELLLDHGADPNAGVDSSGSPTYAARTHELRQLLIARGGRLDAYDLVWLGEDDEAVRRVAADPAAANDGCGGVLAAACKEGKRELFGRLLEAGARVPPVLTACRSYLMSEPDMLRLLLAKGAMDPNLPNWQYATPLHELCQRDGRGRANPQRVECARILLEAGASLTARDEDYRSTPLGWAARSGLADMAELLLDRGSPTRLPDDEPWATPLAWASRRGHAAVAAILTRAGATS